jgi:hypothetical protein
VAARERYEAFEAEDENEFVERLSHYKVTRPAEQHIGDEPPVPLIYLASKQDRRDEPHVPGYNEEWLSGSSTALRPYASTYVDTDLGPAHKLPPAANHVPRYPVPHIGGADSKQ